jgi:hypothetical protein
MVGGIDAASQCAHEPVHGRDALTRRQVLAGSLAGSLGLGLAAQRVRAAARPRKPNIVFMLADDLG